MKVVLSLLEIERCKREDVYNAIWLRFLKNHNEQDAQLMTDLKKEIDEIKHSCKIIRNINL